MSSVKPLAHRGGPRGTMENSLKAIHKALEAGFTWMELDIRVTKDDRLIVMHDATLGRTTNARGYVDGHTLAELKQVRLLDGQQIPTLEEVFELVDKQATLLIHVRYIKRSKIERSFKALKHLVKKYGYEEQIVIIGFSKALKHIQESMPEMRTSLLSLFSFRKVRLAVRLNADFIQPLFGITERFVRKAKMQNLEVMTWPIKKENKLNKLIAKGVTHIVTKFPYKEFQSIKEKGDR